MTINRTTPTISLIAAVAHHHVLGMHGKIPWHIPEDFAYFKKMTMGKPIIMGRKTFESIGKALPGRLNIILTRQKNLVADHIFLAHTYEDAIQIAQDYLQTNPTQPQDIMIIGGAQIYQAYMPLADNIYLTHINLDVAGDAYFPAFYRANWKLHHQSPTFISTKNNIAYTYQTYQKDTGHALHPNEPDPSAVWPIFSGLNADSFLSHHYEECRQQASYNRNDVNTNDTDHHGPQEKLLCMPATDPNTGKIESVWQSHTKPCPK